MKIINSFQLAMAIMVFTVAIVLPIYGNAQKKSTSTSLDPKLLASKFSGDYLDKVQNFKLTDSSGNQMSLSDFKGKLVFADLWYSGCGACITTNKGIRTVHDSLANQDIVFLSISVDKSREIWMQSITPGSLKTKTNPWAGMYVASKGTIMLYTSGRGHDNDFRKYYVPLNSYPKLLLFDKNGLLIAETPPRPDVEPGKLIEYLNKYQIMER